MENDWKKMSLTTKAKSVFTFSCVCRENTTQKNNASTVVSPFLVYFSPESHRTQTHNFVLKVNSCSHKIECVCREFEMFTISLSVSWPNVCLITTKDQCHWKGKIFKGSQICKDKCCFSLEFRHFTWYLPPNRQNVRTDFSIEPFGKQHYLLSFFDTAVN